MSLLKLDQPILIACDHGAYEIKKKIIAHFTDITFEDLGCNDSNSVDYPDFAHSLIQKIAPHIVDSTNDPTVFGILLCGSGQGMSMTANKNSKVRAALCWNEEVASLARSHNNSQVLCLGARLIDEDTIFKIIKTFLSTSFEGGRHINRINKI